MVGGLYKKAGCSSNLSEPRGVAKHHNYTIRKPTPMAWTFTYFLRSWMEKFWRNFWDYKE